MNFKIKIERVKKAVKSVFFNLFIEKLSKIKEKNIKFVKKAEQIIAKFLKLAEGNIRRAVFVLTAMAFFFGYKNYDAESNMITLVKKDPMFLRIEKIIEEKNRTDKMFQSMNFEKEIENICMEKGYLSLENEEDSLTQTVDESNFEQFEAELKSTGIITKIEKIDYETLEGETLKDIADAVHRSTAEVLSFNRAYAGVQSFEAGKKISVKPEDVIVYEVKSGENLYGIAERYKVSFEDIKAINGKENQLLVPGEKIFIPYHVTAEKFSAPLDTLVISSPYGTRVHPIKQYELYHMGMDFVTPEGTSVYSGRAGEVIEAAYEYGYGKVIKIEHDDGYISIYGHLSEIFVNQGDRVEESQLIAASGNTGLSTGPHLHFEVRKDGVAVNPAYYIEQYKKRPFEDLKVLAVKAKQDMFYTSGVGIRAKERQKKEMTSDKIESVEIIKDNYISSRL